MNVCITNELARIVGLIAKEHPECSIQIEWNEGAPEHFWLVTALDGTDGGDHVYIVDDEAGHWAPARDEDLQMAGRPS